MPPDPDAEAIRREALTEAKLNVNIERTTKLESLYSRMAAVEKEQAVQNAKLAIYSTAAGLFAGGVATLFWKAVMG